MDETGARRSSAGLVEPRRGSAAELMECEPYDEPQPSH
jgi:hypothetical protein